MFLILDRWIDYCLAHLCPYCQPKVSLLRPHSPWLLEFILARINSTSQGCSKNAFPFGRFPSPVPALLSITTGRGDAVIPGTVWQKEQHLLVLDIFCLKCFPGFHIIIIYRKCVLDSVPKGYYLLFLLFKIDSRKQKKKSYDQIPNYLPVCPKTDWPVARLLWSSRLKYTTTRFTRNNKAKHSTMVMQRDPC